MAFERLKRVFRRAPEQPERKAIPDIRERRRAFSTELQPYRLDREPQTMQLNIPEFKATVQVLEGAPGVATFDEALESHGMDSATLKQAFTLGQGAIPDDLFNWFSQQGFIGYQACAIVSQHWLVNKSLMVPAKDSVRNGYQVGTIDGEKVDLEVLSRLREIDKKFKLPKNLVEFATNTRRFGVRLALFVVESDDDDYYRKPFNIDGVKPGSYKGISQVDPSWIAPVLDHQAAANPASMQFYEPTWWMISGQLYHHSHLIIARYVDPPDVLKPTYQYGGIPLTQLILERIYAAERTANEAPMLAETKRLNVVYADIAAIEANPGKFETKLQQLIGYRNNYGVYVAGTDDRIEQIETSLQNLDDVIMTQYQLVAAVSEVPATKLLGTSPKGFNATGEFEQASYGDLLENIQSTLTPLVERHHELVIRSEDLGENISTIIVWNPVSSPNAKEQAEINLAKAQEDNMHLLSGAIDANDIRNRLIADPASSYPNLEAFEEMEEIDDDLDFGELDGPGKTTGGEAKPLETAEDGHTLGYVSIHPTLEVGGELALWVARAGIVGALRPDEFHATLAYSAVGVPDYKPDRSTYDLVPTGEIGILGAPGTPALVVFVESPELQARQKVLETMGAVSEHDEYLPHVSIKKNPSPEDFEKASAAMKKNGLSTITMGGEIIQTNE